jgi:beta-glucosidase
MQCGGWTIEWQGKTGDITPGTTLLAGIKQTAAAAKVVYDPYGEFKNAGSVKADVGVVVVGEAPYAEGVGDSANPSLSQYDVKLIEKMRARSQKLVVVVYSGRPIIITDALAKADAWVAAWLPGTEGQGVADVLFGDQPFVGKLSFTWPRSSKQLPIHTEQAGNGPTDPLFPFGFGLSTP